MESAVMTSLGSRLKRSSRRSARNSKNTNVRGNAKSCSSVMMRKSNMRIARLNSSNKRSERDRKRANFCNRGDDEARVIPMYKGKFSRQVYNAICLRLGPTLHIPADSIQELFNDMQLFPSKTQVSQMLQIARQCGNRNGGPHQFLTFGEFLVFFREMQKSEHNRKTQQTPKQTKCTNKCEVFLGGSCNPTTWRTDTAIPELKKHGISFYNPQVSMWAPELVAQEHDAKQSASVLLYVVDSQTRSTGGMIEVSYLVAGGRCVVLVVHPYREGQAIMGEPISQREYLDLVEAQATLLMLVKSQGVKVHSNLISALQNTANILRNSTAVNGSNGDDVVTHRLKKLREAFDSYDTNQTGHLPLNSVLEAYYRLTNRSLKIAELYSYLSASKVTDPSRIRISFEQFCALVAEFGSDQQEATPTPQQQPDERIIIQPLQRQCSNPETTREDSNHSSHDHDIFLGGSCHTSVTWRRDVAIPLMKKYGLTYYNPALREEEEEEEDVIQVNGSNEDVEVSDEERALEWKRRMDRSRVLLFVISNDTRSLTSLVLAAHYVALGADVVLCTQQLPADECKIGNEKLTKQAIKDYNRGRVYLMDFARRKQVPVFENITEAVQCAVERCVAT